ncbi:TPA: Abi family protein [Serratia marcescens]|uniref:Abi family protein n=1 Tax=Serratia marcescens TaxID=615 RepID=UPI0036F5A11B
MTLQRITDSISDKRLATYQRCFATTDMAECLGLYIWNKRVCAEFLPVLQILEVSLRNAICSGYETMTRQQLIESGKALGEVEDLLNPLWFKTFYEASTEPQYEETKKAIGTAERKLQSSGLEVTADNIIPQLSFGVWNHICQSHLEADVASLRLWPKMIPYSFPGRRVSHGEIARILRTVNKMRNRIAHHEPLWFSKDLYGIESYLNKVIDFYYDCLRLIEAINPSNLKSLELVGSHHALTSLLMVQSIEQFRGIASDLAVVPTIDVDAWHQQAFCKTRIEGAIIAINQRVVVLKPLRCAFTETFVIDRNEDIIKSKLDTLRKGMIVTFIPKRYKKTRLATKVLVG